MNRGTQITMKRLFSTSQRMLAEAAGEHAGGMDLWRKLTFFGAFPVIALCAVKTYLDVTQHPHEPPEFIKYDHLRIRTKESKWLRLIFHLAGFVFFAYDIWYHLEYLHYPESMKHMYTYGGMFKYLTVWDLFVQCGFYLVCALCDVRPNQHHSRWDVRFKDFFFAAFAFPLGLFVSMMFWSIYAVDRELILPSAFRTIYPWWLNHMDHSAPIAFILIEAMTLPHFVSMMFWSIYAVDRELILPSAFRTIYPWWLNHMDHSAPIAFILIEAMTLPHVFPSRWKGMSALLLLALVYLGWILYLALNFNVWVYPFLKVMSWPMRGLFIVLSMCVFMGVYMIGDFFLKRSSSAALESGRRSTFLDSPISSGMRKKQ
ncbi:unnamed protein product [Notodromas monacha]|uniref:Androgen-dependent TFPI-regulating protein n=1 Tax=Notodromas monacha TaxID=399045 RepID=A0A7R9BMM2_9CRUS|nr:unnamed protein product [Notodromas monacha]CAG0916934.1 unnamed protein product [Notodromas monacha]